MLATQENNPYISTQDNLLSSINAKEALSKQKKGKKLSRRKSKSGFGASGGGAKTGKYGNLPPKKRVSTLDDLRREYNKDVT